MAIDKNLRTRLAHAKHERDARCWTKNNVDGCLCHNYEIMLSTFVIVRATLTYHQRRAAIWHDRERVASWTSFHGHKTKDGLCYAYTMREKICTGPVLMAHVECILHKEHRLFVAFEECWPDA